jgi:hypothetical protein
MSLILAAGVSVVIVGLVVMLSKHLDAKPPRPALLVGDLAALACAFYALLVFLGEVFV